MTVPNQIKCEADKLSQSHILLKRDDKGRFVSKLEAEVSAEACVSKKLQENKTVFNPVDEESIKTKKTSKGSSKAATSKKDAAAEVKAILKAATPEAARLLIEIMLDEERPLSTRLDCANKIIERVCGKVGQNSDSTGNEVFKIVLSDEVKKYAK